VGHLAEAWVLSFSSWSVSDPAYFHAGFRWWSEFGFLVIGIEPDLPWGVVDDAVMMSAEQGEVSEAGSPAGRPVDAVVGVAHHRGPVAAGERAVPVSDDQRGPDPGGYQAFGPADVEDLGVGAERGGDDLGVAGEPADRGSRQLVAVAGEADPGEAGHRRLGQSGVESVQGHGHHQSGGGPVGVGGQVGVEGGDAAADQGVPGAGSGVAGVADDAAVVVVECRCRAR